MTEERWAAKQAIKSQLLAWLYDRYSVVEVKSFSLVGSPETGALVRIVFIDLFAGEQTVRLEIGGE